MSNLSVMSILSDLFDLSVPYDLVVLPVLSVLMTL